MMKLKVLLLSLTFASLSAHAETSDRTRINWKAIEREFATADGPTKASLNTLHSALRGEAEVIVITGPAEAADALLQRIRANSKNLGFATLNYDQFQTRRAIGDAGIGRMDTRLLYDYQPDFDEHFGFNENPYPSFSIAVVQLGADAKTIDYGKLTDAARYFADTLNVRIKVVVKTPKPIDNVWRGPQRHRVVVRYVDVGPAVCTNFLETDSFPF